MERYDPMSTWGELAAGHDATFLRGDEAEAVAFLSMHAGGGPALELAVGTGRIALPLAATGIRVDGIDFSPAMLDKLRAKPGADRLSLTLGDMADVDVPGNYRLIYVIFNSLFNLLTQEDQVRCFRNAASHLTGDGAFIVEGGMTPAFLDRLRRGSYLEPEMFDVDVALLDLVRVEPATQMLYELRVLLTQKGTQFFPVAMRYAWPAELDLMAQMAGLRLKERWSSWTRQPFTVTSENVISVYVN
jgi:SAM-dependent methyltransferase